MGMSAEQFFQVVLLPQGQFARFLHADADERRALLQKLFRTDRFRAVEDWLAERRRATRDHVQEAEQALATLAARIAQVAGVPAPGEEPGTPAGVQPGARAGVEPAAAAGVEPAAGSADSRSRPPPGPMTSPPPRRPKPPPPRRRPGRPGATSTRPARPRPARVTWPAGRTAAPRCSAATTSCGPPNRGGPRCARNSTRPAAPPRSPRTARMPNEPWQGWPSRATRKRPPGPPPARPACRRPPGRAISGPRSRNAASAWGAWRRCARWRTRPTPRTRWRRTPGGAPRTAPPAIEAAGSALADLRARQEDLTASRDAARLAAARLPLARAGADRQRAAAADAAQLADDCAGVRDLREQRETAREHANDLREEAQRIRAERFDGMIAELAARLTDDTPCPVCGSLDHPDPSEIRARRVTHHEEEQAYAEAEAAKDAVAKLDSELAIAAARMGDLTARLIAADVTDPVFRDDAALAAVVPAARGAAAVPGPAAAVPGPGGAAVPGPGPAAASGERGRPRHGAAGCRPRTRRAGCAIWPPPWPRRRRPRSGSRRARCPGRPARPARERPHRRRGRDGGAGPTPGRARRAAGGRPGRGGRRGRPRRRLPHVAAEQARRCPGPGLGAGRHRCAGRRARRRGPRRRRGRGRRHGRGAGRRGSRPGGRRGGVRRRRRGPGGVA